MYIFSSKSKHAVFMHRRVRMIRDDGWACEDWCGVVVYEEKNFVAVRWDNRDIFYHSKKNIEILADEPNRAFILYKKRKKKNKKNLDWETILAPTTF